MGRSQRHMILEQGANAASASLDEGVVAPGLLLQVDDPADIVMDGHQIVLTEISGIDVPIGSPGGPLDGSTLTGPVPNGGGDVDPPPPDPFGIISINPASMVAGMPDLTATITGAGFEDGAVIVFGGVDQVTEFLSDNQVRFLVDSSEQPAGSVAISVRNPGGEVTADFMYEFTVAAPGSTSQPPPRVFPFGPFDISAIAGDGVNMSITLPAGSDVRYGDYVTIEASGNSSINAAYTVIGVTGDRVVRVQSTVELPSPIENRGRLTVTGMDD